MTYLPPHFQETDAATLQYRVGKWKVSQNQPLTTAKARQPACAGVAYRREMPWRLWF